MRPLLALLLLLPAPALAGVGVTASVGGDYDGTAWAPSLDWREGRLLVQLHLLDQLAPMASGVGLYPRTGLDVAWGLVHTPVTDELDGVVMPGVAVRIDGAGPVGWNAGVEARAGVELHRRMGMGVYVVPKLGVTTLVTGSPGLNYGGALQVSVWASR